MNRVVFALLTVALTTVLALPSSARATASISLLGQPRLQTEHPVKFRRATQSAVPLNYIVVLSSDISKADLLPTIDTLSAEYGGHVNHIYRYAVTGFSVVMPEVLAIALSNDPRVALVEEDTAGEVMTNQSNPGWGLDRIDQVNLPVNNSYVYTNTGLGVDVYVVDTGIRANHQQFLNAAGTATRVVFGTDTVNDGQNGADCFDHGTGVAGIIGGRINGTAKDVTLWNVRVFGCPGLPANSPSYSVQNFIAGVDWITQHHATRPGIPAVANVCISYPLSSAANQAVKTSIASGITYVIAAGNHGVNAIDETPARVPEALTIGATGAYGQNASDECLSTVPNPVSDLRAGFSNYGKVIDLFAPGVLVVMPSASSTTATRTCNGTSFSAPYVTGVAALYLQSNPTVLPKKVRKAIKNNASLVVQFPGPYTTNRLLYSRFNFSITVTSTCDPDEQFVCEQEGGVWNSSTCSCDIPLDVPPDPCPTCQ